MLAANRQDRILARFLAALSLSAATAIASAPCAAAEVSLARVDATLIKSFLPRSDLEVVEDIQPQQTWEHPDCREQRDFDVREKDGREMWMRPRMQRRAASTQDTPPGEML